MIIELLQNGLVQGFLCSFIAYFFGYSVKAGLSVFDV